MAGVLARQLHEGKRIDWTYVKRGGRIFIMQ